MLARVTPLTAFDPFDIAVGNRIRLAREERGLTQADLAVHIGVSFQQLQKYETAANRISCSRLKAIAVALNVPIAELVTDDDDDAFLTVHQVRPRDVALARRMRELDDGQFRALSMLIATFESQPRAVLSPTAA